MTIIFNKKLNYIIPTLLLFVYKSCDLNPIFNFILSISCQPIFNRNYLGRLLEPFIILKSIHLGGLDYTLKNERTVYILTFNDERTV